MRTGITLSQLAAKIESEQAAKRDFIVPSSAMHMSPTAELEIDGEGSFPIRPIAHDQIGGRLGIPSKYYDRMLSERPDLLATNVNAWLSSSDDRRMVRILHDDARAVLSDRYQRIDNAEIAEVALPVLARIPDVQIVSSEITERRMYIQAVSPRIQGEVKVGDVVQAGVIISNSEVGSGAVSISPMVYRLRCLNGMVLPDQKFRAYHVGRQIEDTADLWRDDTRKADDRAILLKVRDMVSAAVDQARFNSNLERMQGLTRSEIKADVVKAVEVLTKTIGATDVEGAGILQSLIKGGDLSAWGFVNAVTAQAHAANDYDRSVELETAGGALLNLNKGEWTRILEAA
jgi:hypothetical protein